MPRILILLAAAADKKLTTEGQSLLRDFRCSYDLRIASAQTAPAYVRDVVSSFQQGGGQIILCLASPQDLLASLVSSQSQLPVLQVAVTDQPVTLQQLPGPLPVATIGTGSSGFTQAALFALQLLALQDAELSLNLQRYRHSLAARMIAADQDQQVSFHV